MILDIDAGNSFVKWRVKDGAVLIGSGFEPTEQVMAAGLDLSKIDSLSQARVASVAHQRLVETLRKQLQRQFNVELRIARVSPSV
ncbi:MAG: hypothetical protein ACPHJ4_05740, partial [Porticoccaceae bacterium]